MILKSLKKSIGQCGYCILLLAAIFESCGECKPDKYGEVLELVVPMTTTPVSDSIALGDTLWIDVYIEKEVRIFSSDNFIRLDSFRFFTEMFVSEISGTVENYYSPIDTIVRVGRLDYLPLTTALSYPVTYKEYPHYYEFAVGIVPKSKGIYWIGLATSRIVLSEYDHPAMYACDNNHRDEVRIHYSNSSTSQENFESVFKQTHVSYLQNVNYEDFASVGSVALVVY